MGRDGCIHTNDCWNRCGPIMPTSLVDMLVTCHREVVEEEEEEREDVEMDNE